MHCSIDGFVYSSHFIIQRERDEVLDILNKEGGDLDEIMHRVRAKTMATREKVLEEYEKGNIPSPDSDDVKETTSEDEKAQQP